MAFVILSFLAVSFLFFSAAESSRISSTAPKDTDLTTQKIDLRNLSIGHLTGDYFKDLNPDLTYLKISNSKIDKIDRFAFDSLKHLNLLELSDNEIHDEIDSQTFTRLPGLEILVLRNSQLQSLNLNLTNVQELILSQNEIENVRNDSLVGRNINYLDLSNNKIRRIIGDFGSLFKLSMIDLSKNKIVEIENDTFAHNGNLIRILASENKITTTSGFRLPWLKTLDLFSNKIAVLDSESFSKMSSLEELVLAFNNIRSIDRDSFRDLIELKFLNLAWNHIEEIAPDVLRNNIYLNRLSLQGNKLTSLRRFSSIHYHLFELDVSHNALTFIDPEFFTSMPNLNVLDMSFNRLKTVTELLTPLSDLRILNLAYNEILLNGHEFSRNPQLIRVNLSSNGLEMGLSNFRNNNLLTYLDLSDNEIYNFCDDEFPMKHLIKINLRGNQINNLICLKSKNFSSICEIDLRHNPMTCGQQLDDFLLDMAVKRTSPFKLAPEYQSDVMNNQCDSLSAKTSFDLWNSVKRELCPKGEDLKWNENEGTELDKEEEDTDEEDESSQDSEVESFEETTQPEVKANTKKNSIVFPIAWIRKEDFMKGSTHSPQSERISWEQIDENAEIVEGLEEQEQTPKSENYRWYTIALILIGLSLTLTCFNFLIFLYIRTKVGKKADLGSPNKYTVLQNEIYKNTTEPTNTTQMGDAEWFVDNKTKNKIFSYGKINEVLLSFGGYKKDKDSESAKNVLIHS